MFSTLVFTLNPTISVACDSKPAGPAAWGAVLAMSLVAFALVEFMPLSLFTPLWKGICTYIFAEVSIIRRLQ